MHTVTHRGYGVQGLAFMFGQSLVGTDFFLTNSEVKGEYDRMQGAHWKVPVATASLFLSTDACQPFSFVFSSPIFLLR